MHVEQDALAYYNEKNGVFVIRQTRIFPLIFRKKACLLPQEKTGFNLKSMFFLVYFDADFT